MDDLPLDLDLSKDKWPDEANEMYERIEVLGKGSFGLVWMAKRVTPPENPVDDEFVAIKNINITSETSRIYAKREISILAELRHPNVIRLIRSFPVYQNESRLVVMQLARGPNLQSLVKHRGALGLPLSRLVSRHLVAAVSYLHGRAVLHRDIKPTNCILENIKHGPNEKYNWKHDDLIWSDGVDAEEAVKRDTWKLILIDFGFARALKPDEIMEQKSPMRQSIVNESTRSIAEVAALVTSELETDSFPSQRSLKSLRRSLLHKPKSGRRLTFSSVSRSTTSLNEETEVEDPATPAPAKAKSQRPPSKRMSTARFKLRSMSALGTKNYAAPEIREQLRNKTGSDIAKSAPALTECVADYGMIVDAYSVGWTLSVVITGVPPNYTASEYLQTIGCSPCCTCFPSKQPDVAVRVRTLDEVPRLAANLIAHLTMTNPKDRMTVREAQNHPWIRGRRDEKEYMLPEGDIPSRHSDPVVPLKCAGSLPMLPPAESRRHVQLGDPMQAPTYLSNEFTA